jgi:hypothetical protein
MNEAAFAIRNIDEDVLTREVTKSVFRSDTFAEGHRFIAKNQSAARIHSSEQAIRHLKAMDINIGNLAYTQAPSRLVSQAISGSPEFRNVYLTSNDLIINQIDASGGVIDVEAASGSLAGLAFEYRDVATSQMPICPVSALDEKLQRYIKATGTSATQALRKLLRLANQLRRDPLFPRDLVAERVLEIITRPKILTDVDAIAHVLVAMGAATAVAASIATQAFELRADLAASRTSLYSLDGTVLTMCNFKRENMRRFVIFDETGLEPVDALLYEVGAILFTCQPYRGGFLKVHIDVSSIDVDKLHRELRGVKTDFKPDIYRNIVDEQLAVDM